MVSSKAFPVLEFTFGYKFGPVSVPKVRFYSLRTIEPESKFAVFHPYYGMVPFAGRIFSRFRRSYDIIKRASQVIWSTCIGLALAPGSMPPSPTFGSTRAVASRARSSTASRASRFSDTRNESDAISSRSAAMNKDSWIEFSSAACERACFVAPIVLYSSRRQT